MQSCKTIGQQPKHLKNRQNHGQKKGALCKKCSEKIFFNFETKGCLFAENAAKHLFYGVFCKRAVVFSAKQQFFHFKGI